MDRLNRLSSCSLILWTHSEIDTIDAEMPTLSRQRGEMSNRADAHFTPQLILWQIPKQTKSV
jgi:hypothetical protein